MVKETGGQLIKRIILEGTPAEKREIYDFTLEDSNEKILKRFKLFARGNYPRYFPDRSAPFHDSMVMDYIRSYRGECNGIEIAFRGSAKTSLLKLFVGYVLVADKSEHRKYIKLLSKDFKNARQFVTDVYNNILEVEPVYGDVFEKDGDKKREETMSSFTLQSGRKLTAGTVGQTQRGHLQDAFRPDWICFEDIEDRESISSIVITESIINRCDEAIQGLSFDGSYQVNANYISDAGTVQWFLNKPKINSRITPIVDAVGVATWERYTDDRIEKIKAETDDWAGEYLCLKPDTRILTRSGYNEISTLKVGDSVITHLGVEHKILQVFRSNGDDLLDITVNGKVTTITKNHPVLSIRDGVQDWVNAGELTTDDLVISINEKTNASVQDR